jgi:hypothetical protein
MGMKNLEEIWGTNGSEKNGKISTIEYFAVTKNI